MRYERNMMMRIINITLLGMIAFPGMVSAMEPDLQLINAARYGDIIEVRALIAAGADLNVQDNNNSTALILAADNDYHQIVRALIAAGADLNVQNNDNDTVLILAAYQGYNQIVDALIAAKAALNVQDNDNDTALICAARSGHLQIVNALIAAGAVKDIRAYEKARERLQKENDEDKREQYRQIITLLAPGRSVKSAAKKASSNNNDQ